MGVKCHCTNWLENRNALEELIVVIPAQPQLKLCKLHWTLSQRQKRQMKLCLSVVFRNTQSPWLCSANAAKEIHNANQQGGLLSDQGRHCCSPSGIAYALCSNSPSLAPGVGKQLPAPRSSSAPSLQRRRNGKKCCCPRTLRNGSLNLASSLCNSRKMDST